MNRSSMDGRTQCMDKLDTTLTFAIILLIEGLFTFLCSTLAFILNLTCTTCLVRRCRALSYSVRLLTLNVYIAMTVRSFYLMYKSISNTLFAMGYHLITKRIYCTFEMFIYVVAHEVCQFSLLWLGADRLHASFTRDNNGTKPSRKTMCFQVATVWMLAICFYFFVSLYGNSNTDFPACFCQVSTAIANPILYKMMTFSMIAVQFSTCFISTAIRYRSNNQLNHIEQSTNQNLNKRFMMWSNLLAAKWLLLVSVLHSSISTVTMITSVVNNQFGSDSSNVVFIGISISIYLIFAVDHLIHPIICVRYSQTFASAFVYMVNKLNVKVVKKLMSLLVGIKFDNQSGKLFDQKAASAFTATTADGIVQKRRLFQHRSRTVVKHNLNPENNNQLLNVIWESAKMNPRRKC